MVGVDLGGTKICAVRCERGEIVERQKRSTPRSGGPGAVLEAVAGVVELLDPSGTCPVGVGVPGPVSRSGVVTTAVNLTDWHDVDVAGLLGTRLAPRPVAVDNDVNAGTYAEFRVGAARGCRDVMGVFVGTGVGAGLIIDGRLRRGPRGGAGEIGHTFVSFRDLAGAATSGRLEDHCGRAGLERRARHLIGADVDAVAGSSLRSHPPERRITSRVWAEAYESGDALAIDLVDEARSALAASVASAVLMLDVDVIVLGGGLAERLGEPFRAALDTEVNQRCFGGLGADVRRAGLGDVGGALGAALLAQEAA